MRAASIVRLRAAILLYVGLLCGGTPWSSEAAAQPAPRAPIVCRPTAGAILRGAVPGHNGAYIMVRPTNKFGSTHGVVRAAEPTKNKVVLQKKGK